MTTTTPKPIPWFLRHVAGQLGNAEHPLGSNAQEYGRQFGWDDVSWCVEFAWCMYDDAGIALPVKTASCVALYDASVKAGLHYTSDHCTPADSVIRTWQQLDRHAPGFDPAQTHCQIVEKVRQVSGVKYLGLIGGNQGAGYVGPAIEWVRAGDASILGGLAFHRLWAKPHHNPGKADKRRDGRQMPAAKSHKAMPTRLSPEADHAAQILAEHLAHRDHPPKAAGRELLHTIAAQIERVEKITTDRRH